jgi:glycosyltransferase involved in cell wall biosynthesis
MSRSTKKCAVTSELYTVPISPIRGFRTDPAGKSRVNILHIINSVDPAGGGPAEGVKQLGTSLVSAGHRVEVASLDPPDAAHLNQFPLPVFALGPGRSKYAFSRRFIPWLQANHSHYDAVVVNGVWQFHSFATWRTLRNSNTPYVLFTHGMLDPWFKKRYPLKHFKKWMYWPWAEYRVLRDAQAVLFTSQEERLLARKSFWLYRCNEVVINYGTAKPSGDPHREQQEFLARFPELRDKKIALFMGRIHPKKGCDLLIEAFAKTMSAEPEWQIVIAGPDQIGWESKLRQHADRFGIASQITWTGMLRGSVKWGALRAAKVLVLPSHQENFGIVVAEALAVGTPVLISNKVNIWREIQTDAAGIVAEDTLAGTCDLLQTYLDKGDAQKLHMRRRARECFEQRFEIHQAAEALRKVLLDIRRNSLKFEMLN